MRKVAAGKFKAQCLQIMDEVEKTGRPVVITKRGRPIVELGPVVKRPLTLRGAMKGQITITGDIVGALDERWNALEK
jgi:prevent-host-death family protein